MPAILDQYGRPMRVAPRRTRPAAVRARYDSAQTNSTNAKHWANADALSANAAASPEVRRRLRMRSRYEAANNSYCRCMVDSLAGDVIGTGPRVQALTGNSDADEIINREFGRWLKAAKIPAKLRAMRKAKCVDGETIGLFVNNPRLLRKVPVSLDLRVLECDRLAEAYPGDPLPQSVEGIKLDAVGEPEAYYLLDEHPGDVNTFTRGSRYGKWYDAADVIHLYRQDRPEQRRGVPETTPALPIFSQLRRWTLAVLTAAEVAADLSAIVKTSNPPDGSNYAASGDSETEPASYEPFDTFDIDRGVFTVLPEGTDISQLKAEQPAAMYADFKRELLAEAFAAILMPYIVGANDSSDSNFASGKLDKLGYNRLVTIDRSELNDDVVWVLFLRWYEEASLYLRLPALPPVSEWVVTVFWDELGDIDEVKSATATEIKLRSGQTSYPSVFAAAGKDGASEQERQAEFLGLSLEEYRARLASKLLGPEVTANAAA